MLTVSEYTMLSMRKLLSVSFKIRKWNHLIILAMVEKYLPSLLL